MNNKFKEALAVLMTASALFAVVVGLSSALQFEPQPERIPDLPEPPPKPLSNVNKPALSGLAKTGASLFAVNCAHCHGDDARGDEGPSLYDLQKSDARIATIVKEGIKGEMPKFGSKFNDTDIESLIAFLRTLKG